MKPKLLLAVGFLMMPVCVLGLWYQQSFIWVICPQALVVMFLRQSRHAYDSLGAAGFPDLTVALLYYPLLGWILSRASRTGRLPQAATRAGIWHAATIALAFGAAELRNQAWGFR